MEEPTSSDDKKLDKTVEEASDVEKDGTVPEEDSDSSSSSGSVCQCDLDDDDVDKTKAETSDVEENDTKPAEPASSAEPQHSKDNQDDVPKVAPKAKRGKGPRASTNFKRCAVPPKLGALKLKRKKRYMPADFERRLRALEAGINSTITRRSATMEATLKLMRELRDEIHDLVHDCPAYFEAHLFALEQLSTRFKLPHPNELENGIQIMRNIRNDLLNRINNHEEQANKPPADPIPSTSKEQ